MLGLSDRKMSELRGKELRAILDPAGREGYNAELAAGTAPVRKRGRPPKGRTTGSRDPVAPPKRKRGRPRKVTT